MFFCINISRSRPANVCCSHLVVLQKYCNHNHITARAHTHTRTLGRCVHLGSRNMTGRTTATAVAVIAGVESISRLLFAIDSHCTGRSLSPSFTAHTAKYMRITVATQIYGSLFFSVFIIANANANERSLSILFAHLIFIN